LVILGRVDGELADELAGGGVHDAGVEAVDEYEDAGAAVGRAEADVVQAAVDAQGDASGPVDDVVANSVVDVVALAGAGFGSLLIRVRRCASLR
jgi:hypothetical protein